MATPLVWMPGGTGRFILPAIGAGGGAATMVGAMIYVCCRPLGAASVVS